MNKHQLLSGCLLLFSQVLAIAQVPATWSPRGVGAGGALYSPTINPADDNEYYLGCDMSELFHTLDFGDSYSVVPFTQVQGGPDSGVRFTRSPGIAYTVSYSGNNAAPVRTSDGGATWTVLPGNPLPYDDVYSLWADYENPDWVIVAGYSTLYFSNDGGNSFNALNVTIDPGNGALVGGVFFDGANIYLGTNAGLIVSTDSGATWTNAGTPGIPAGEYLRSFAGAKSPAGTMRFFCLTVAQTYPGQQVGADYWGNFRNLYSMDNAKGSWVAHSTGLDPNNDFLMFVAMAANDINTVYAGGSTDLGWGQVPEIVKTSNAGQSWANVFRAAYNQNINTGWEGRGGDRDWTYGEVVFGLAVAPGNPAKVVFTDMGSVHRSSDGGATWQQAYVNSEDQHAVNTTTIAGTAYHSIGLENTTCWQVLWSDSSTMFAGFTDIRGIRSTDGGMSWSFKYTGDSANTMYRLVQHPTNAALYAATSDIHDMYESTHLRDNPLDDADAGGNILSSTDKGATWHVLHAFGHPVFWIALNPNNPDQMYASVVSSTAGGVFVTNDLQDGAASTWTRLPAPPRTEGHPASLVVLNDGSVVCTYSGHLSSSTGAFTSSSGVFLYSPGTGTWTDVSDPGMYYWTRDVVVDPGDPAQNTWYVGVFSGWGGPPNGLGGLYRTTNRGVSWTRVNSLDRVTAVTFNPANGDDAFLTTGAEGLWHTDHLHATAPAFTLVSNYPFRQPQRVYFNPYDNNEVWVTSFGNGLVVGQLNATVVNPPPPVAQPGNDVIATGFVAGWTAVTGATGYRLDVSTESSFNGFVSGHQNLDVGNVTSLALGDLNPGTTYYYRVRAYTSAGVGASSNAVAVTTPPAVAITTPLAVVTLAGQALSYGSLDATGSAARFHYPSGVAAADNAGNLYVADTNNDTIRKIAVSTGAVTTLAGSAGLSGSADGTGSSARFNNPSGVAVDGSGNVYVADTLNNTLRLVSSSGVVTTIAGSPHASGSLDGTGTAARFLGPQGLAIDSANNLYVADTNNDTIRKFVPSTGAVTTLAGAAALTGSVDGPGSTARFDSPFGVAVDSAGNVYVADTDNHTIRKIAPSGTVTTLAGLAGYSGGADGTGSKATFDSPSAVAVDSSSNVYVADTGNFTIRRVVPGTQTVTTLAGLAGASGSADGLGSAARFYEPAGIAADNNGNLYIADTDNHTIRQSMLAATPSVQTQPQSQTVTAGASAQFSVTATGYPAPTYEWTFNGAPIAGATSSTYLIASAQSSNAGNYAVTIANAVGTATSNTATLTVNPVSGGGGSESGGGGGGGGGGAPSVWFILALALSGMVKWINRVHRGRPIHTG